MRDRQIVFIAGMSRSGKTVLARNIAAVSTEVVILDPVYAWAGKGVWGPDPWGIVATKLRKGFRGTFIFDDADRYLPKSGAMDTWGTLWSTHRWVGVDLVMITKRVHDLPPVSWSSASRLICFRMKPQSLEASYLKDRGHIPDGFEIPGPSEKFHYLDIDLDSGGAVRRVITPAQLKKYGGVNGQ